MVEVSTPFHVFIGHGFFATQVSVLLAREPLLTKPGSFPRDRYVHGLKVVCPPYTSDQDRWACVLEVFDFSVHPKKLPEADNTARNPYLDRAYGSGVSKSAGADATRGRADDSHSGTLSSSSPWSPSSSPPSTRPSSPNPTPTTTHEVSYTVHTESSKVSVPDIFIDDVISKLPYTHTVRKDLCAMYSGFMIDDERIVGLKVGVGFFLSPSWRTLR